MKTLTILSVLLLSGCVTQVDPWQSDISCIIPSEWRDSCTPASPKLYSPERDYRAIVLDLENTL